MKPALTIAELAKVATFGANKLKKAALENAALSAIIAYDLIKGGKVLRVETKAPNPVNEETPIRRFLELEKNEDNKQFFADIENGNYLAHGELRLTEFADTFLEQYFKKIEAVFGYGSEPQLDKVIHNGKGGATVVFSSVKDGKRVNHNASWTLTDIKDDFDKTVLIPRSMFKSYNEFMTLFCEALGQPKDRFFLKDDPMEVKGEGIDVYVEGTDLVYYGKLTVSLPWSGTEVNVIDNGYVVPEEPSEGEEEPGEDQEEPNEPPVTEPPVVAPAPKPQPAVYNTRPTAQATKADGSFLNGTGLKSGNATNVDDTLIQLTLAPYNAGKSAIGPSVEGVYPAATAEISCLFAVTSLTEAGVATFADYDIVLAKNGVDVMKLENNTAWTGVNKADYILTDSAINTHTVQNVTRERFLIGGTLVTEKADPEVYSLTAKHKATNATIAISVTVPKVAVAAP